MEKKKPKCILIDARVVEENYAHGIACYAFELVNYILENCKNAPYNFIILINKNSCLKNKNNSKNIQFVFMKTSWTSLWGQLELLKIIWKYRPSLFHSPSFIVPLLSCVKLIATIHDMNHVALSQNYSMTQKIYYLLLAIRLKINSKIITVSNFSKQEIVKYLKVPPSNIEVIYNGISSLFKPKNFFSLEQLEKTRKKYQLPEKFVFTIGNEKPHKNLEFLLDIYCQENNSLPLVVLTTSCEKLLAIAQKYPLSQNCIFLSAVEEQISIAHLYALCDFFIFPSLYEGFGFPPLEAAACGAPVLSSCVTSMPEILEASACYFSPNEKEDLKLKIKNMFNMSFSEKEKMIEAGLFQSQKFNWKNSFKKVISIYENLIN